MMMYEDMESVDSPMMNMKKVTKKKVMLPKKKGKKKPMQMKEEAALKPMQMQDEKALKARLEAEKEEYWYAT